MFLLSDIIVDLLTTVISLSEPFEVSKDRAKDGCPNIADLVHDANHDRGFVGTKDGVYNGR